MQPGTTEHNHSGPRIFTPGQWLLFALLTLAIFHFPEYPGAGLDPSWEMVLGRAYHDHLQFGRDIVYNYGPLGFLMANIYFGLQSWSLVAWQAFSAPVFAGVIVWTGRRLHGVAAAIYFLFFLLFGVVYADVIYMIAIAMLGVELVRRPWKGWWNCSALIAIFFAAISMMKFTNLVFAAFAIAVACVHHAWNGRREVALRLAVWFCGGFAVIWMLCGQNPANIPAYLYGSWQITSGYQEAMGTLSPPGLLWKAVAVLALLAIYLLFYIALNRGKKDAFATATIVAAFVFFDWKHGFVRADAHMLVFFVSALTVVTAFPAWLDDAPRLRRLQRAILCAAGALSFWAICGIHRAEDDAPEYARDAMATLGETVWGNISQIFHPHACRESYRTALALEKREYDLPLTRSAAGGATVDMIGYEQAVVFYNGLNYAPRPVFQSMSAYNPFLAELNRRHFLSAKAPQFVLVKIESIDDRLPALDDSAVLDVIARDYQYVHTEKKYSLWKRRPDQDAPGPQKIVQAGELAPNTVLDADKISAHNLWVKIDLQPSLMGRIRGFLYKPPLVNLTVEDTDGQSCDYTLPLSQARAGFILNPVIEETGDFLDYAAGRPGRRIRSLKLDVDNGDKIFFANKAAYEISALPPPVKESH